MKEKDIEMIMNLCLDKAGNVLEKIYTMDQPDRYQQRLWDLTLLLMREELARCRK